MPMHAGVPILRVMALFMAGVTFRQTPTFYIFNDKVRGHGTVFNLLLEQIGTLSEQSTVRASVTTVQPRHMFLHNAHLSLALWGPHDSDVEH